MIINKTKSLQEISDILIKGFSEELNIFFIQGPLSNRETIRAKELVQTKFGLDEWTFRI